jgi:hypothetical protein
VVDGEAVAAGEDDRLDALACGEGANHVGQASRSMHGTTLKKVCAT